MNAQSSTGFKGTPIIESYLKKKKERPISRIQTSQRYFKFDLIEKTFSYKDQKENPEIKVIHVGKDLKDFEDKIDPRDMNICDWTFGFKIITTTQTYVLFAESKEVYTRWIRLLNFHFNKIDTANPQSVYNMNNANVKNINNNSNVIVKNISNSNISNTNVNNNNVNNNNADLNNMIMNNINMTNIKNFNSSMSLSSTYSPTNGDNLFISTGKNNLQSNNTRLDFNEDFMDDLSLLKNMNDENPSKLFTNAPTQNKKEIIKPAPYTALINVPLKKSIINESATKIKQMTLEEKVKQIEEDQQKSTMSEKMIVLDNMRNNKVEFKVKNKEEVTTKIQIQGENNNIEYIQNDNVKGKSYNAGTENVSDSKIKLNQNSNTSPRKTPVFYNNNNIFGNLNDDLLADEINTTKFIRTIIPPENVQMPATKTPLNSNKKPNGEMTKNKNFFMMEAEGFLNFKNMNTPKKEDFFGDFHAINGVANDAAGEVVRNLQGNTLLMIENNNLEKATWNEINDGWGDDDKVTSNKGPTVNQLLGRNDVDKRPKEKPKPKEINLFDDPHLHIKKSVETKKYAIENLHFTTNATEDQVYNNIEGKISTKPPVNYRQRIKRPEVEKVEEKFEVATVKITDGNEVNVKRKIVKNEEDSQTFTMNLVLPEQLAKFGDTSNYDRIKIIKDRLLNPNLDHAVYLGKQKNCANSAANVTANVTTNVTSNATTIEVKDETVNLHEEENMGNLQLGENQHQQSFETNPTSNSRVNFAELIMKPGDKKALMNDIKNSKSVSGNRIREDFAHDDFHMTVVKTYKMEANTFLGDDHHLPTFEIIEDPKKEDEVNKTNIEQNITNMLTDGFEMMNASSLNMNSQGNNNFNNISVISNKRFSMLNIEEVWDNSIINDSFDFEIK